MIIYIIGHYQLFDMLSLLTNICNMSRNQQTQCPHPFTATYLDSLHGMDRSDITSGFVLGRSWGLHRPLIATARTAEKTPPRNLLRRNSCVGGNSVGTLPDKLWDNQKLACLGWCYRRLLDICSCVGTGSGDSKVGRVASWYLHKILWR